MSKAIAGINLGGYNMSVVEGVDLNGFHSHLIENALSQKLTKAVIEYKENIRHVGYNISTPGRRSRNVFTSPKSILGLNKDECVEDVKYFPSIQVVGAAEHPDVDIQEFRLNFLGNDKFVNSFQIYISFIKFLNEMIKNVGNEVTEYVISYPPYYNEKQLLSLKELLKELNVSKTTRLIPEYIASGLCYGYENNDRLKSNGVSEIITIIDMGYICSSCSIFKYENDEMKLCLNKNEKLGGRDIDKVLMEYIYDKMKIVCGDLKDLYEDFSLYKKIEKSIINCKEKLSADGADEIMLSVESFYEDEDFETTLTVDDLNKLLKANGFDERLKNLVYETIKESGLNEEEVKKLEIVIIGGSMRIPLFKTKLLELLKETNGKDKLIQTLNMDENDAYGCCYYGGIKTEKWKYKIENFKEKTLFESDERIREIINESLEKDKEMEEEDNKTKRNSSYRNELEGIKFQLLKLDKNKVEGNMLKNCLDEIIRILNVKNNTFENHYRDFDKNYGDFIFKHLNLRLSISSTIKVESEKKSNDEMKMNQSIMNRRNRNSLRFTISNTLIGELISSITLYSDKLDMLKKSIPNLSNRFQFELDNVVSDYTYKNKKLIVEEISDLKSRIAKESLKLDKILQVYDKLTLLSTFIAFADQKEYLTPLQKKFDELNEENDSKIDDYEKLQRDIEDAEMKYSLEEQNTLIKRITDLQTDGKYREIMTQSCILPSILNKSQNTLLQCITKLNNGCSDEERRDAINYLQYTIDKLEMRKRANDIKNKLIDFLNSLLNKIKIKNPIEKNEIEITINSLRSLTPYNLNEGELNDKYNHYQEKYTLIISKYEFEKILNELKVKIEELKEYGIDRSKSINSVDDFSKEIDNKSSIEIQKVIDKIKKLNNRYSKHVSILKFKSELNKKRNTETFPSDEKTKVDEFCNKTNEQIVDDYDYDNDDKGLYNEVKKIAKNHDPKNSIPNTPNPSSSSATKHIDIPSPLSQATSVLPLPNSK